MDMELIQRLVQTEWELFQATQNEGGRAPCQDDYETFRVMRTGQAMGWSSAMAASWLQDLEDARSQGRNPVMEKYARMMAFTAPEEYRAMEHLLPPIGAEAMAQARRLTAQTVAWAEEAEKQYPYVLASGRPIRAGSDTPTATSLETYCYGELLTCSGRTLSLFEAYYGEKVSKGENLYIEIQTCTARLLGYASLAEAERTLYANTRSCCHGDLLS